MNAKSLLGYALSFLIGGGLVYFLLKDSKNTTSDKSLPEVADSESFVKMLSPRGILGLVDTAIAHPNMRGHADNNGYAELHRHNSAKVKTVLHDSTEFRNYMNTTFLNFTKTHTPAKGYVWQIGVYPMIFKQVMAGQDKARLSFYFIPTMAKYNENGEVVDIIDYMKAIHDTSSFKIYYVHDLRRTNPSVKVDEEKYIFDEGQLWP
jgi:hypothetical protein